MKTPEKKAFERKQKLDQELISYILNYHKKLNEIENKLIKELEKDLK